MTLSRKLKQASSHPAARKLTWAPPTLVSPITLEITDADRTLVLDQAQDYILYMTERLEGPGGLGIWGGHNIRWIGGEINIPASGFTEGPGQRRALYFQEQTGTLHVEGIHLTGSMDEAIDFNQRQGSTVQLQNILIDQITGTQETAHADLIQSWAGPHTLLIDGFEGYTTYQGTFLEPQKFVEDLVTDGWSWKNMYIEGNDDSGLLLWKSTPIDIGFQNVYVRQAANKAFWPNNAAWTGVERVSSHRNVLSGSPGMGYVSPGYL